MESLRIVMVSHTYPPYVGGLSSVVENLSKQLVKMGHEVEVVTLYTDRILPEVEDDEGVLVRRFPGIAPAGGYFIPSKRFIDYLSKVKSDIYHLHNIGALTVPAAWMAVNGNVVLSPHLHRGGYAWHAELLWKLYRPYARKIVREADIVHAVSPYEASLIGEIYGVNAVVVPNGIREDVLEYTWTPPSDRIVLTYAGRMEGYKNVDKIVYLAAVLKRIINKKITVRLIGNGPRLRYIVTLSRRFNVDLKHYGFLPRRKYLSLLSSSTLLVNLSYYEAYSIVTAEAIAVGLPVLIAKPWSMTFEGIEGVFSVNPDDLNGAVRTVLRILIGSASFKRSSIGGVIATWDRIAARMVRSVYRRVL